MSNKQKSMPTIRSATAEYLTFVAATGDSEKSIEMRYDGKITEIKRRQNS